MDHNKEFDGIRQADNALPPWWKHIFVACIVFAVCYATYYHLFSNWKMQDSFNTELQAFEKAHPVKEIKALDGGQNPLREDAVAVKKGEERFKQNCAACHGQNAEGTVGPSLMDQDWLHGDYDDAIFNVIKNGVNPPNTKTGRGPMPAKGGASLSDENIYQILAWIATKNPSLKKVK